MDQKIEEYVKQLAPLEAQINRLLVDMAKDGILPQIMTYQEALVSDTATMIEISIAPIPDRRKSGAYLIAEERKRQIDEEGWTSEHDDEHKYGELLLAAACYILWHGTTTEVKEFMHKLWPWDWEWWKPKDLISNLKRAGALIAAEIDRLKRIMGDV